MFARKMGHKSAAPQPALVSLHLAKEVSHIQDRAAEHDGRIVSIGPLVLFSTDTGDAWILEPANHLASKLASDGDALCTSKKARPHSPSSGRDAIASRATPSSTKTTKPRASLPSAAIPPNTSCAKSARPREPSREGSLLKFQICLVSLSLEI